MKRLTDRLTRKQQLKRQDKIEARKTQIRIVRPPLTFETRTRHASDPMAILARGIALGRSTGIFGRDGTSNRWGKNEQQPAGND